MKKTVNLQGSRYMILRQYVKLINPMMGLRNRELDLLAKIIEYYLLYEEIKRDDLRWKLVFDYDTRFKMMNEVNMGKSIYNNTLTRFRQKGILKNNQLVKNVIPTFTDGSFDLVYSFKITESGEVSN